MRRRLSLVAIMIQRLLRLTSSFLMILVVFKVNAFVPLAAQSSETLLLPIQRRVSCLSPYEATTTALAASLPSTIPVSLPSAFPFPSSESLISWWYLSLLAVLFGTQPFFQKKYVPKTICRSTVVLAQELTKFATAASLLWASGGWEQSVAGTTC